MAEKKDIKKALEGLKGHLELLDEAGAGFVFADERLKKAVAGGRAVRKPARATAGRSEPFPASGRGPAAASPARPAAKTFPSSPELEAIKNAVLACTLCPLSAARHLAVPGEGNPRAELMFVGEAPGRDEDAQGRPFVGRAGQLLRRIIAAMNFAEEEVFIANVIKCRPPDNRVPKREEIEVCSPYLEKQIAAVAPKIIVTLGKTPTEYFVPGSMKPMGDLRGKFFDHNGVPVVPTFHPSYLVRNEWNRELRKQVWEDMQKVMEFLGRKRA